MDKELLKKYFIKYGIIIIIITFIALIVDAKYGEKNYNFNDYIIIFISYIIFNTIGAVLAKYIQVKYNISQVLANYFGKEWEKIIAFCIPIVGYFLGFIIPLSFIFPVFNID